MKRLLPFIMIAGSLHAEGGAHKLYRWSVAALAAGNAADMASSFGQQEMNPVLGHGNFGARQAAIKGAVVGGGLLLQRFVLGKRPDSEGAWVVANFAAAGVFGGVAIRNWRER